MNYKVLITLGLAGALLAGCGSAAPTARSAAPKNARDNEGPDHPVKHPSLSNRSYGLSLNASKGSAGAGSGKAVITLMSGTARVCWTVDLGPRASTPTGAYIHAGAPRVTGPVVVPFGAKYSPRGCTTASSSVINAIVSSPADYYLSIASLPHPAGALRAQL